MSEIKRKLVEIFSVAALLIAIGCGGMATVSESNIVGYAGAAFVFVFLGLASASWLIRTAIEETGGKK